MVVPGGGVPGRLAGQPWQLGHIVAVEGSAPPAGIKATKGVINTQQKRQWALALGPLPPLKPTSAPPPPLLFQLIH